MHHFRSFRLVIYCLLITLFFASCTIGQPQESVSLLPSQEFELESIRESASAQCDAAFSSPITGGTANKKTVVLKNIAYEAEGEWEFEDYPHFAHTVDDLGSLICIKESRIDEGSYTDGTQAYRRDWSVRLVSWPDGGVVSEVVFEGDPNPISKQESPDDVYGRAPYDQFMTWAGGMNEERFFYASDNVKDIDYSPTETSISFLAGDQIGVWMPDSNTEPIILSIAGGNNISYSPDGSVLAASTAEGFVFLFDTHNVGSHRVLQDEDFKYIDSLAFSPDGKYIAAGIRGTVIDLWEFQRDYLPGLQIKDLETINGRIVDLDFSPDSSLIAGATGQDEVVVWNVDNGEKVATIKKLPDEALHVAFSSDGQTLAIGGTGFLSLWNPTTGKNITTLFQGTLVSPTCLAFSLDGRILVAPQGEIIRMWDITTGEELNPLYGHTSSVTQVVFSPQGMLVSASKDKTIRLWTIP